MKLANPGDNVGISIRGIGKTDMKRGDMIGDVSNAPVVAKEFTAQIMIMNHLKFKVQQVDSIIVGVIPVLIQML